jgi:hypothetical protein
MRLAPGLPLTNSHNTRSATLTFHIPHAGILHGLGGYFEAVLYGEVGLSIHPTRKEHVSKDMLSWFPLFFPLRVRLFHTHMHAVLSPPPARLLRRLNVRRVLLLTGTVVLAEQLRAAGFHLAPDGSTTGVV